MRKDLPAGICAIFGGEENAKSIVRVGAGWDHLVFDSARILQRVSPARSIFKVLFSKGGMLLVLKEKGKYGPLDLPSYLLRHSMLIASTSTCEACGAPGRVFPYLFQAVRCSAHEKNFVER